MSGIFIVGVGMTHFGKFLHRSVKDLTREAVESALSDAGANVAVLEAVVRSARSGLPEAVLA